MLKRASFVLLCRAVYTTRYWNGGVRRSIGQEEHYEQCVCYIPPHCRRSPMWRPAAHMRVVHQEELLFPPEPNRAFRSCVPAATNTALESESQENNYVQLCCCLQQPTLLSSLKQFSSEPVLLKYSSVSLIPRSLFFHKTLSAPEERKTVL